MTDSDGCHAAFLAARASHVRNFCMLAHVDHGKTTLSDHLLTANGLLSQQLAGKVRFLDSRPDEQERLITMKASCVALGHRFNDDLHLVHLVDSPGHIDFSSEVSAAMRACDGALIIVDVIDGVTMQTRSMLRHAFNEGLQMILVVNKLDLLMTTLQLTPEEAMLRIHRIVEDCNVVLSTYLNMLEITNTHAHVRSMNPAPEDELWFSPPRGNVVFASGAVGYGFTLESIARTWISTGKLGKLTVAELRDALWGEQFLDPKTMTVSSKAKREGQRPMVVNFVFEPLWNVNDVFTSEPADDAACAKISSRLGVPERAWKSRRSQTERMEAVLQHWLPLASCLLDAVCTHLPSVVEGQRRRLPVQMPKLNELPASIAEPLLNGSPDGPVVVYISKLIDTEYLAGNCQFGERSKSFEDSFVGFGRVYCGTLKPNTEILIRSGRSETKVKIGSVFLLRGQGLELVSEVLPGRLCGVGGVASHIIKHGTLTSEPLLPPILPPGLISSSIVQYVVRPKRPDELEQLLLGLHQLYQTDPQVELVVLPTGEYVMGVAGEVHGERCIEDLKTTFARVEFAVSPPIVQYREAIVAKSSKLRGVEVSTPCNNFSISIAALPYPDDVVEAMSSGDNTSDIEFYTELRKEVLPKCEEARRRPWRIAAEEPLSVGPVRYGFCGCALHVGFEVDDDEEEVEDMKSSLSQFRDAIVSGFQLAINAGPLCEEPMFGVCFFITDILVEDAQIPDAGALAFLMRQAISTTASACRQAFQAHSPRIVEPLCECVVHSAGATQGKIYNILNRRRASIEDEVMAEGGETFYISCQLPVGESFGLQDDLRIATSGAATAQLQMSRWKMLDFDPYFKPTTKDEIEEYGTDAVIENVATTLVEEVRQRKGIQKRNVVEFAEKQKFSMRGA